MVAWNNTSHKSWWLEGKLPTFSALPAPHATSKCDLHLVPCTTPINCQRASKTAAEPTHSMDFMSEYCRVGWKTINPARVSDLVLLCRIRVFGGLHYWCTTGMASHRAHRIVVSVKVTNENMWDYFLNSERIKHKRCEYGLSASPWWQKELLASTSAFIVVQCER